MKVNFKQLESFVWVSDLGSFKLAAERLNTTQPNISSRINTLESSLDVVLMHRDAGSVRLTPKGKILLSKARRVLSASEDFISAVGNTSLVEGCIRVGVTEMVANTRLFEITAPANCILNALHPAPVALRHVVGQLTPDTVYNALDQILPKTVPAEGSSTLCNFQVSLRLRTDQITPNSVRRGEVLTFNSGGAGARPIKDGLSATAFPSGVMTMPVKATEHAGLVVIWRKELRPDSGGCGKFRGGLGQYMDVGALEGHEFDFQAMFDRVDHPTQGRQGGGEGASTSITRDNGVKMKGKDKQFVPHGQKVCLAFPGGAGYGQVAQRSTAQIRDDFAKGYITEEHARSCYGLSKDDIDQINEAIKCGEFDKI